MFAQDYGRGGRVGKFCPAADREGAASTIFRWPAVRVIWAISILGLLGGNGRARGHPFAWICAQSFLTERTHRGGTVCFLPRRGHPHGGTGVGEEGCRTCPGLPSHHRRLRVRGLQRTLLLACRLVTLRDLGVLSAVTALYLRHTPLLCGARRFILPHWRLRSVCRKAWMCVCGQCLVAGRRLVKGRCGIARLCTRECDSAPFFFFLAFTFSLHTRGRPSRGNVFASNDGLRRENGDAAAFFAGHERHPRRGLTKSPAGVDWDLNHCVCWYFGVERFSFLLGCWAH
ncbi:hypothetical protein TcCL_ESM00712 [Trypanosoma cruzi]|nr:hypothetical protein TcCL_ESM00712 [Trypanosoma cruzi]